jgi:hypothetical protein
MSDMNLTDWLTFRPAGVVRNARAYIDLPAFSYSSAGTAGDASVIVAQFNFSASRDFFLATRPVKPTGVTYGLCIKWRVGDVVYRYKLWEDPLFNLTDVVTLYNKQRVRANFVLEVWSFPGTASVQGSTIRMITSVRTAPTDFRSIADYALAVGAEFTSFANTNVNPSTRSTDNLVADYSADVGAVEIDLFDKVMTMYDQSGNARHLTQAVQADRPDYSLFAPPTPTLAYPTVIFNGVNDILEFSTGTPINFQSGYSLYIVGCIKGTFSADSFMFASGNGANNGLCVKTGTTDPDLKSAVDAFTSSVDINAVPNNEMGLIEGFLNLTNIYLFGNGILPGTNNGVVTGSDEVHGQALINPTFWSIGGAAATSFCTLQLGRMLLYNTQHNLTQRTAIRQFLEGTYLGKYAFPLTFNTGSAWLDNAPL